MYIFHRTHTRVGVRGWQAHHAWGCRFGLVFGQDPPIGLLFHIYEPSWMKLDLIGWSACWREGGACWMMLNLSLSPHFRCLPAPTDAHGPPRNWGHLSCRRLSHRNMQIAPWTWSLKGGWATCGRNNLFRAFLADVDPRPMTFGGERYAKERTETQNGGSGARAFCTWQRVKLFGWGRLCIP